MSHQIAAAIILNGINQWSLSEGFDLDTAVPSWFELLHPKAKFPREKPELENAEAYKEFAAWRQDPCYDMPENFAPQVYEYWEKFRQWQDAAEAWAITEKMILFRKWVFYLADFCDINQDFTLKYRYQQ